MHFLISSSRSSQLQPAFWLSPILNYYCCWYCFRAAGDFRHHQILKKRQSSSKRPKVIMRMPPKKDRKSECFCLKKACSALFGWEWTGFLAPTILFAAPNHHRIIINFRVSLAHCCKLKTGLRRVKYIPAPLWHLPPLPFGLVNIWRIRKTMAATVPILIC